jgi:hypothetical protein
LQVLLSAPGLARFGSLATLSLVLPVSLFVARDGSVGLREFQGKGREGESKKKIMMVRICPLMHPLSVTLAAHEFLPFDISFPSGRQGLSSLAGPTRTPFAISILIKKYIERAFMCFV